MPYREDVAALAEAFADAVGAWGACPDGEQARCARETFCRTCWVIMSTQRMRDAVHHEQPAIITP